MKRRLVIGAVTLLLVLIELGGCVELGIGDNFITVVVQAQACVAATIYDDISGWVSRRWAGATLHIEINKAGGERVTFDKTTDAGGCTEIVTGTSNVYKEQYVEAVVTNSRGHITRNIRRRPL